MNPKQQFPRQLYASWNRVKTEHEVQNCVLMDVTSIELVPSITVDNTHKSTQASTFQLISFPVHNRKSQATSLQFQIAKAPRKAISPFSSRHIASTLQSRKSSTKMKELRFCI